MSRPGKKKGTIEFIFRHTNLPPVSISIYIYSIDLSNLVDLLNFQVVVTTQPRSGQDPTCRPSQSQDSSNYQRLEKQPVQNYQK